MKILDLEPHFMRVDQVDHQTWHNVDTIAEAQGVMFLCPVCFVKNGGNVGTHAVCCWSSSAGTPPEVTPGPGRWKLDGTGYADLTLNPEPNKSRSVLLNDGCNAHFFVTNGDIQIL